MLKPITVYVIDTACLILGPIFLGAVGFYACGCEMVKREPCAIQTIALPCIFCRLERAALSPLPYSLPILSTPSSASLSLDRLDVYKLVL